MNWQQTLIAALAGAAAALASIWLVTDEPPAEAAPASPVPATAELLHRLDDQAYEIARLYDENRALADRVTELEEQAVAPVFAADEPSDTELSAAATTAQDVAQGAQPTADATQEPAEPTPAQRMVESGMQSSIASTIEQRVAELEMERLYLRDRATREGWRDTERFDEAVRELATPAEVIRGEYGDEVYDQYLYAMGRGNRVLVVSTLHDSPAEAAGIQAGDAVVSYNGERIYSVRELQRATSGGEAGSSVVLELDRGGSRWFATVPRGPLGVRLETERQRPSG